MTVGIIFATQEEAQPFIELTSAIQTATRPLAQFKLPAKVHPACVMAISGMGKVAATMAATHLVVKHQAKFLINAGLCGCLTAAADRVVGDLLRIDQAVEGDCDRYGKSEAAISGSADWFQELSAACLVTCDRPVFDPERRKAAATHGDLADMEGAAVARVAQSYDIGWALLKGISDGADETGRHDLARNLESVSQAIATTLLSELQHQAVSKA